MTATLGAMHRALRLHQWAKNLLIFAPLAAAHQFESRRIVSALLGFLVFGLCASAIYVINDLFDIPSDRLHPTKRRRPFAAGALSVRVGVLMATAGLAIAAIIAVTAMTVGFLAILLVYVIVALAYSARLKREPVIDIFVLASLYVVRIFAGAIATDIPISNWFLGFGLFFFLSLACVKRYTELIAQEGAIPGRGYSGGQDQAWMLSIGTVAGYTSVVILALYINSPDIAALYTRPKVVWLACPVVLFWITRLWLRASRQQIDDDPLVEALQDPGSWMSGLAGLAILIASA